MNFTPIYIPKAGTGHKVFKDKVGQIVLADWSGSTPDQTEDGPLYPDPVRPCQVHLSRHGLVMVVPVRNVRNNPYVVHTTPETVSAIQHHMYLRLELTSTMISLAKSLKDLCAMGLFQASADELKQAA